MVNWLPLNSIIKDYSIRMIELEDICRVYGLAALFERTIMDFKYEVPGCISPIPADRTD